MRNLLILLYASLLIPSVTRDKVYGDSWAIIVGINEYEDEKLKDLNYAISDAESIRSMLTTRYGFSESKIDFLVDEDATRANIMSALDALSTKTEKNDRVLFFFAGHGESKRNPSGGEAGYLIPVDGNKDRLYSSCIAMKDLDEISDMYKAKHMLFLVDACYSGLAAMATRGGLDTSVPGYIDKITKDDSRIVITAGSKGEEAIEKAEWGNSAFTKNLIAGLGENFMADYNADGFVTSQELALYLKQKVDNDTNSQQTPQDGRLSNGDGEFVFFNISGTITIDKNTPEADNGTSELKEYMDRLERLQSELLDKMSKEKERSEPQEPSEPTEPTEPAEEFTINLPGMTVQIGEEGVTLDTPGSDIEVGDDGVVITEPDQNDAIAQGSQEAYNEQISRIADLFDDFEDRIDDHIDTFRSDIADAKGLAGCDPNAPYLMELKLLIMNLEDNLSTGVSEILSMAYKSGPTEGIIRYNLEQQIRKLERQVDKIINNMSHSINFNPDFKRFIDDEFEEFEEGIEASFEQLDNELKYEFSVKKSEELSSDNERLVDKIKDNATELTDRFEDSDEDKKGLDFDINLRYNMVTGIGMIPGASWTSDEPLNLRFSAYTGIFSEYEANGISYFSAHRIFPSRLFGGSVLYLGGAAYKNMVASYDTWLNNIKHESIMGLLIGQTTYDYISVSGYDVGLDIKFNVGLAQVLSVKYFDHTFGPLDNATDYSLFNGEADRQDNLFGSAYVRDNNMSFATRTSGVQFYQHIAPGNTLTKWFSYIPDQEPSVSDELLKRAQEQGIDISTLVGDNDGPEEVFLVGESPNWGETKRYAMSPDDKGRWGVGVPLYPGKYLFSFEVDGERVVSNNDASMVKKRRYKGQEVYQYSGIGLSFGFSSERGTWEHAGCPSPAEESPAPTQDIAVYEQECDQSQEPVEYYLDIGNCGIKIPIDMSSNLHLRWVSGFNYQGPVQRDPYIGGVGTIRGYAHKAFSDQSVWLCNVEYEFILGGWDGKMSKIFLFTDFGSHYLRESRDWFVDDPNYFENFKQSIGMGFDWAGIRLYYAKPLDGGSDFSLGIELSGMDLLENLAPYSLDFGVKKAYE